MRAAGNHREADTLRGLEDDERKRVVITEPAGDLIRLAVTHLAQHRKDTGVQCGQVIQVFAVDAAYPEPVALGRSSISDTDSHGRARK